MILPTVKKSLLAGLFHAFKINISNKNNIVNIWITAPKNAKARYSVVNVWTFFTLLFFLLVDYMRWHLVKNQEQNEHRSRFALMNHDLIFFEA